MISPSAILSSHVIEVVSVVNGTSPLRNIALVVLIHVIITHHVSRTQQTVLAGSMFFSLFLLCVCVAYLYV